MLAMFGRWKGSALASCRLSFAAAAFAVMAVVSLGGCKTGSTDKDIRFISPEEGQKLVAERSKFLGMGTQRAAWVDPRTEAEYKAGHIPGAINLPWEHLALDHKKLDAYDLIVVYGNDYNDAKADGFSKRVISDYSKDVRTLYGGLRAWKAAGTEVEVSH